MENRNSSNKSLSRKIMILNIASFLSGALSIFILNPFVIPFYNKLFPGFASRVQAKSNITTITVVSLNDKADLQHEEQVFMDAYSYLYKDMNVPDLADKLHKKFENEQNLLREKKLVGFHVCVDGKIVAWLSLMPLEHGNTMRIMCCAIHPTAPRMMVSHVLSSFIFEHYPQVNALATVCLKSSTLEKNMLTEFGFKECQLIDSSYDAELYTSFEYRRPA